VDIGQVKRQDLTRSACKGEIRMDTPQDYFDRKRFAGLLLSHLKILPTPFAMGLDAPWGHGKTFFVQNILIPEAEQSKLPLVVYDAFEHEKDGDVFLSLVTTILENTSTFSQGDRSVVETAILDVAKATGRFVRSAIDVTANALSKTVLRQSTEDIATKFSSDTSSVDNFASCIENSVEKFIIERTQPGQSYRDIKESFKLSMRQLICAMSDKQKLIVVIDDLDRCTPKHALEVFEAVHHLLNTDGIIFVFSYHREQIERMIEHTYGKGINSAQYLNKFIGFNIKFPEPNERISKNGFFNLATDRFKIYQENVDLHDPILVDMFNHYCFMAKKVSAGARMTQSFASLAVAVTRFCQSACNAMSPKEVAIIMYWLLNNHDHLVKLASDELSVDEVKNLRKILNYDKLKPAIASDGEYFTSFFECDPSQRSAHELIRKCVKEILTMGR
jgi:hypothetical protein